MAKMDEIDLPIPCEGQVPQVQLTGESDPEGDLPVVMVPCALKATQFIGQHNNPGGAIDHGASSNRDAAREGRYDPLNPNRRFVTKGRGYRK
jgi:hypothetical protein